MLNGEGTSERLGIPYDPEVSPAGREGTSLCGSRLRSAHRPWYGRFVRVLSIRTLLLYLLRQPKIADELLTDARHGDFGRCGFGCGSRARLARAAVCALGCAILERFCQGLWIQL